MATIAKRKDFEAFIGEAWPLEFPIDDLNGVEVPLDGAEAVWTLVSRAGPAGTEYIRKTTDDDITIDGSLITVDVSDEDAAALVAGRAYHYLQVTPTGGVPRVVSYGQVTVRATGIQPVVP